MASHRETRRLGPADIKEAAAILRGGGTVAFATETVYGLGADASNPAAAAKIFQAKGRPAGHPLIVHVADVAQFEDWAAPEVDDRAKVLAEAFWPGPLTLVVPHNGQVSAVVVGSHDTVGLRIPNHSLALELLREFGGGVAAPSANRFGHVSPTTAAHVLADLDGRIDAVVDGGECEVGLESTIIELNGGPPTVLRVGGLPLADIERVLGEPVVDGRGQESRAAGMMASHYAPSAQVVVTQTPQPNNDDGVVAPPGFGFNANNVIELPADSAGYARGLYGALRSLDAAGVKRILVVPPQEGPLLAAVLDRLEKASN